MNQVTEVLGAVDVDLARLAQLKLSLQEKLRQLDSEVLDLTEDEHLENEIQHAVNTRMVCRLLLHVLTTTHKHTRSQLGLHHAPTRCHSRDCPHCN